MAIVYAPHADVFQPGSAVELRRHYSALFKSKRRATVAYMPKPFISIVAPSVKSTVDHERDFMLRAHAVISGSDTSAFDEFSLAEIMEAVSDVTGITQDEMCSPSRQHRLSRARQMYFYMARQMSSRSLSQIGRFCGGRDHTTVLHGANAVMAQIKSGDFPAHRRAMIARAVAILEGRT